MFICRLLSGTDVLHNKLPSLNKIQIPPISPIPSPSSSSPLNHIGPAAVLVSVTVPSLCDNVSLPLGIGLVPGNANVGELVLGVLVLRQQPVSQGAPQGVLWAAQLKNCSPISTQFHGEGGRARTMLHGGCPVTGRGVVVGGWPVTGSGVVVGGCPVTGSGVEGGQQSVLHGEPHSVYPDVGQTRACVLHISPPLTVNQSGKRMTYSEMAAARAGGIVPRHTPRAAGRGCERARARNHACACWVGERDGGAGGVAAGGCAGGAAGVVCG